MKILFPTDYSNAAENAFLYALKVAERLKANITVMHAFEGALVMSWTEEFISSAELIDAVTIDEFEKYKAQVKLLKRLAKENELDHIEVKYSLREAPESVVKAILDEAIEHEVDLIVVGTTGAKGLKELFFGSIASRVMQSAACPVLVIPDKANYRGIERIGLTLEYKPGEMELVKKALELTRKIGGQLDCVHVDAFDPTKKKTQLAEYTAAFAYDKDISFHTHYDLNVERGILDYMKTNQMDIIIMEMREERHLMELFSYSIAKRVSYHSDIPLLAFPNPNPVLGKN
jgi:nucleotide-binding universal stress UspA family protein